MYYCVMCCCVVYNCMRYSYEMRGCVMYSYVMFRCVMFFDMLYCCKMHCYVMLCRVRYWQMMCCYVMYCFVRFLNVMDRRIYRFTILFVRNSEDRFLISGGKNSLKNLISKFLFKNYCANDIVEILWETRVYGKLIEK